jgi:hypothetical protein
MINLTNLSNMGISADICRAGGGAAYSPECLNKWFCPQISHYFLTTGIVILVVCVVGSWASWWFFSKGWVYFYPIDEDAKKGDLWRLVGDLGIQDTRIYWAEFFRDKMLKICMGFIFVLIWFFWRF